MGWRSLFQVVIFKTYADLRSEALRTYVGFLWWVLDPIMYMAALYVVFGLAFERGPRGGDVEVGFVPFLLAGTLTWKWFASSLVQGSNSLAQNAGVMRQVYMPKFVFPTVAVLQNMAKFLIVLFLFAVFLNVYGLPITPSWAALPLVVGAQLLLVMAVAWITAAIVPFLPDLRIVIQNLLTMLFFMSGIFFDVGSLDPDMQFWLYLNPMAGIIESYRHVLIEGVWPTWGLLGGIVAASLAMLAGAAWLFSRFDRLYPKIL